MEGEISANSTVATEAEAFSVELAAPDGWKKKFTPKKGGTPRRNVIVFISPTGEEITNKRQLDQYLRAHPGGPPPSEFDWGTGDTPRRSARLGAKAKPTETPEGEKPTKRERKSSGKRGKKDKDAEGGENEAPKAEEAAAAADEANKSTDVEMKDTEGNADKAEEEAQKVLVEETNENGEQKTEGLLENESSGPVVEHRKEAEKANQEKDVCKTSEGKEDENAEKKMEDSEMLIPTLGVKEGAAAADEAKDSTDVEMKDTEGNADKAEGEAQKLLVENLQDTEGGENEASKAAEGAAAADEAKESTDVEMKDTEGNADKAEGEAQKVLVEKTNENGEQKTEGHLENESSGPVVEDKKETEKANQEKDVSKTFEGKEDENEEKRTEDSEMLIPTLGVKDAENAEKEKHEDSVALPQKQPTEKESENADKKTEDSDILLPASEGKENENADKKTDDSDILLPASGGKENDNTEKEKPEDYVALPQAQRAMSYNDGQHQPKASPVNC